jgi:hypothetical protein
MKPDRNHRHPHTEKPNHVTKSSAQRIHKPERNLRQPNPETYSRTIAITSTKALRAAAAPDAPPTVPPVTMRTVSQKTTSKQFRIAFAFVLAHLRKRRVCSVRSW